MERDNVSASISWLDKDINRFKKMGKLIPPLQIRNYHKIKDHWTNGRTVVDVGCSIGYGSNILSHQARHVWGVDVNEEAIKFANHVFARPNLSFDIMDIEDPPNRPISKFEVIVVSEVIEHLANVKKGLETIKNFFDPRLNSIGFITVPNTANSRIRRADAKNKLHLNRWTPGEFYELMTQHFNSVTMFSGDRVDKWTMEETVDGNEISSRIIIAKVEGAK